MRIVFTGFAENYSLAFELRTSTFSQKCHLDRSEARAKWRDLSPTKKYFYGKISPLQNLLRQIFPVEMTLKINCGVKSTFTNRPTKFINPAHLITPQKDNHENLSAYLSESCIYTNIAFPRSRSYGHFSSSHARSL